MSAAKLSAIVVLGCFIAACATVPYTEREGGLLQRDREWAAMAAEGGDVERLLAFWSDDAIVVPPGAPVVQGKAAIREYVQKALAIPGFRIRWHPANATVSADGTVGYTTGENAVTVPGPDGKLITIAGRYATVWRRDQGGVWRCVIDIWNSGP